MKKRASLLIICFWLLAGTAPAQLKAIPSNVNRAFISKYPAAANVSWLNDSGCYAARFYNRGEPCTVRFNAKGEWLDETQKLSFGNLRNSVRNAYSQSKFASWRAREVNAIREKDKEVEYRILILNNNQEKRYIYIDSKGQIKREVMTL